MDAGNIKARKYETLIRDLMLKHGLSESKLFIVKDVHRWAGGKNLKKSNPWNPFLAARRKGSGIWDIVILEEVPRDTVDSIKSDRKLKGFYSEVETLINTDERFIEHMILHEIAHAKGIADEREADKWAFEEMKPANSAGK